MKEGIEMQRASEMLILELQHIAKDLHEINLALSRQGVALNGDDPGIPGIPFDFGDDLRLTNRESSSK